MQRYIEGNWPEARKIILVLALFQEILSKLLLTVGKTMRKTGGYRT